MRRDVKRQSSNVKSPIFSNNGQLVYGFTRSQVHKFADAQFLIWNVQSRVYILHRPLP